MAGGDKMDPIEGDDRTVFVPSSGALGPAPGGAEAQSSTLQETAPPTASSRPAAIPAGGLNQDGHRAIQIGDVLNHIFEVKRFIARGGMGEVFEGINVNSDERVAIKVMLPSLAADTSVLEMFRKEARMLTRLNHPAIVQYRVLAQEPQLGVFYIVTEFVDGRNLSDVITELDPSTQDLIDLTRRLAQGLEAAHELGAIHRDISPDNVMLKGGGLAGACIIDFGIAKDLNPGSGTIIGDGFAGKLNYVAPEQIGDFNRSIGPWTDVYSLGLVILAVAMRRDVNMGGSLVDAVDKRRAGLDLSPAPEELRPLLERMLKPNPEERPHSMSEVLDLLPVGGVTRRAKAAGPSANAASAETPIAAETPVSEPELAPELEPEAPSAPEFVAPPVPDAEALIEWPEPEAVEPPPTLVEEDPVAQPEPAKVDVIDTPAPPPSSVTRQPPETAKKPDSSQKSRLPLIAGGAGVVVLAALALGIGVLSGDDKAPADVARGGGDAAATGTAAAAGAAVAAGLGSLGCSWLDVANVAETGGGAVVTLRGVAGQPEAVQSQLAALLTTKNVPVAAIEVRDVVPIDAAECGPIDALRQIRDTAGGRISVPQSQFEMTRLPGGARRGSLGASAVVNFHFNDPNLEMALFGIEPSGKITQLTSERAELVGGSEDLGGNRYRLTLDVDHTGWSGLLLLTGKKSDQGSLLAGPPGSRGSDWSQRFLAAAKEHGWKSEMVWFKTVDEQPN